MANYNVTIGSTSTNVTVGYRPTLGVTQQASGLVGPQGDSYWALTSAGIHTLSNVGIGTTNPTSKLHVVGDTYVTGIVTATSFSGNATSATYATLAGIATYATSSGIATYSTNAGIATYADRAGIATYASNAGIATYATSAGIATYATSAGIATYSTNAGVSTYATSSGIATYATNAGVTTYATSSGIATYATSAGFSTNAGIATYASNAGIATYATSSGIATYATNAGTSTSVIGGIASVTQLNVSSGITTVGFLTATNVSVSGVTTSNAYLIGATQVISSARQLQNIASLDAITTATIESAIQQAPNDFNSLNVSGISTLQSTTLIGGGTSTGTASQRLQVTGGAYVSGNLGIGTTNPTSKLDVVGDGRFTGVVTATSFIGNLTGTASTASSVVVDSVGLGTHTYGDYVKSISGTSNQISVSVTSGEGSTPTLSIPNQFTIPQDATVTRDLQVNRNLNVTGNITIGGTTAFINAQQLQISDPDIILGFRTDAFGNDASTDNTANHGGVAVASTEGTPLIDLFIAGIETNPSTYKKIMWFKSGTFSGLGTDAWLINYAVGIGSTQVPNGVRLAAGGMQVTDSTITTPNLNVTGFTTTNNLNVTGISTFQGQIISTRANSTTTGGGQIYLNGATGNRIDFNTNGGAAPSFTTRSVGTKIVLFPSIAGSSVDYAFGIDAFTLWSSVPASTSQFKWYAGTTNIATLFGTGELVLGTTSKTGTASQTLQVTGGGYVSGNLGVGNTNPQRKLHLRAQGADGIFLDNTDQTGSSGGPLLRVRGQRSDGNASQSFSGQLVLEKWRMDGSINSGQNLGAIIFGGNYDTLPGITTGMTYGASIGAMAEGTFSGIGTAPTAIVFNTGTVGLGTLTLPNLTYGTEAARITSNRNLLIGATTETGTASQALQVNSGAYVSGNLGIGQTNPGSKLHVQGDARFVSSAQGDVTITHSNLVSTIRGASTVQLALGANGTEVIRINNSNQVGIGTTNPTSSLHVQGNTLITGIATVNSNLVVNGNTLVADATNNRVGILTTTPIQPFQVGTAGTNVVVIDSIGEIGIGTTSPLQKLHVLGNLLVAAGSSTGQHITQKAYELNSGTLSWEGTAGQLFSITNNLTSGSIFSVNDVSGIPSIDVDANGTVSLGAYGGNIGIGTTNPTSKLDVVGNVKITGISTLGITSTTNLTSQTLNVSGISTFQGQIQSTQANSTTTGGGQIYLNGSVGNRIDFNTNGGAAPTFTTRSAGTKIVLYPAVDASNVDIGFGIDAFTLWSSVPASTSQFKWYAGTTNIATLFGTGELVLGTTSKTGTASQTLQVTGGGYFAGSVGIGTTNPQEKLDVQGGNGFVRIGEVYPSFNGITLNNSTADSDYNFISSPIDRRLFINSPSSINFRIADQDRVLLSSGGNLGINSTSPTSKLDVVGDGRFTGIVTAAQFSTGSSGIGINTDTISGPSIMYIDPSPVGVGTTSGIVRIRGDLYVDGTQFIINSSTIELADLRVGIATTVGTNLLLDGGGIGIGSANILKTITWNNTASALTSSEDWNLVSGKQYEIDGTSVLNATTLGSGVVNSSLTSVGTLGQLQVTGISTFTNGPVFIGSGTSTGTASQRLQVNGGGYFAGVGVATGSIGVGITNPQGTIDIRTSPQWGAFNYGANLVIGGSRNNGIGILDGFNSNPWIIANGGGSLLFSQMPALGNTATPPTEAARITINRNLLIGSITETGTTSQTLQVTGGAYVSGSVGIGTTNPTSKLDVFGGNIRAFGTVAPSFIVTPTSGSSYIFGANTGITGGGIYDNTVGTWRLVVKDTTGNVLIGNTNETGTASQTLQVTGGGYVSGNLGVGRTNPSSKLEVLGTIQTYSTDQTSVGSFVISNAGLLDITAYRSTGGVLRFVTANSSGLNIERGRVDSSGNFIIGTTSETGTASQPLQVTGGAYVSGSVGVGTTNPTYKLHVIGSFAATTKSFVIDHPTKEGMKLRHGSLEGPENGVYVRGRSQNDVINLPDYWTGLVDETSITVNLTPIGESATPRVKEIMNNQVMVFSKEEGELDYFYTVYAERVDVEKLEVEI